MEFVVWWEGERNKQNVAPRYFYCLLTTGEKGKSMKEASNPDYRIQEGFLEEVMSKVKPVLLRPKERKEHAYCILSSKSTYVATFHQPCLSSSKTSLYCFLLPYSKQPTT